MRRLSQQVPQADRLDKLRRVVEGVYRGLSVERLQALASLSARHVDYYLLAARILGFLTDQPRVTAGGKALLATPARSGSESSVLIEAVSNARVVRDAAPSLLARVSPSRDEIADKLERIYGLSRSTALRRASTLLSWRRQLVEGAPPPPLRARGASRREPVATGAPLKPARTVEFPDELVRVLRRDNPWWSRQQMAVIPPERRDFVAWVRARLDSGAPPLIVLRGPRQVGKTTALKQIIGDLLGEGVEPNRILHMQFDELPVLRRRVQPILQIVDWFETEVLGSTLNAAAHARKPAYLFFDEVQNLDDWHVQLKHLADQSSMRCLVTGSSALRIELGKDSLAGRMRNTEVGTLSLREISRIRFGVEIPGVLGENGTEAMRHMAFWDQVRDHGVTHKPAIQQAFSAYARLGGYPLAQQNSDESWGNIAERLQDTIISRVISHDLRVGDSGGRKRDEPLLREVFRLACKHAGRTPKIDTLIQELQQRTGTSVGAARIRNYLGFLDSALLVRGVPALELRMRKQRSPAKLCLSDHGLRAAELQEYVALTPEEFRQRPDDRVLAGPLAESIVGAYLLRLPGFQLAHFPARGNEPEVDFVASLGRWRIPIEVKYQSKIERSDVAALIAFIEKPAYEAPLGVLVTLEDGPSPDARVARVSLVPPAGSS